MNEVDERTPLLENDASKTDLIYERFSTSKKRLIVGIVSCGGLVPCESLPSLPRYIIRPITVIVFFCAGRGIVFTSGTFIPSIPQIAKELNTTGEAVR